MQCGEVKDVRSTVFVPFGKKTLGELRELRERKVCLLQGGTRVLFEVAEFWVVDALRGKRGKGSLGASDLWKIRLYRTPVTKSVCRYIFRNSSPYVRCSGFFISNR